MLSNDKYRCIRSWQLESVHVFAFSDTINSTELTEVRAHSANAHKILSS